MNVQRLFANRPPDQKAQNKKLKRSECDHLCSVVYLWLDWLKENVLTWHWGVGDRLVRQNGFHPIYSQTPMPDSTEKLIRYSGEFVNVLLTKTRSLHYLAHRNGQRMANSMPLTGIQRSEDALSAKQWESLMCHYRQERSTLIRSTCHWMDLLFRTRRSIHLNM